jgi:hypothetical protein
MPNNIDGYVCAIHQGLHMPYQAVGQHSPYPYALAVKIVNAYKINRDDVMTVLQEYQRLFQKHTVLQASFNELSADNLRLKHENEFMLKLVNDRTQ